MAYPENWTPQKETAFLNWIQASPWFTEFINEYGEQPDLDTPDYDYRSAYMNGVEPQRYKYDNNRYHWPSPFKSKDHPTMWMESLMQIIGTDPNALGINEKLGKGMLQRFQNNQGGLYGNR